MATTLSGGRKKLPSVDQQRAERLAALEAQMAPEVEADRAERAERKDQRVNQHGHDTIIGDPGHVPGQKAIVRAENAATLRRNGTLTTPLPTKFKVTLDAYDVREQQQRVEGVDLIVRKLNREDFRSGPDARPMTKRDIANVESLDAQQVDALTAEMADASPRLFSKIRYKLAGDWAGLLDEREIWTLTKMAMEKYNRTGQLPK